MTLNELAYRIIGIYRAQYKNTDSLSLRLVKSWIQSARAFLVRQKLEQRIAPIDEALVQSLGSIKLEIVDSSAEPSISSTRKMKRTKIEIPEPVMRKGGVPAFLRVGPADQLESKFKVLSYEGALASGHGKFNSKDIYAFYLNGYLYFIGRDWNYFKQLEYVTIRGVFQDVTEAAKVTNPDFNGDSYYPIPSSMVEQIENYILEYKLPAVMTGLADQKADEQDNLVNLPSE